jgi:hypothetical protein
MAFMLLLIVDFVWFQVFFSSLFAIDDWLKWNLQWTMETIYCRIVTFNLQLRAHTEWRVQSVQKPRKLMIKRQSTISSTELYRLLCPKGFTLVQQNCFNEGFVCCLMGCLTMLYQLRNFYTFKQACWLNWAFVWIHDRRFEGFCTSCQHTGLFSSSSFITTHFHKIILPLSFSFFIFQNYASLQF